jgi:hypothetical protein
MHWLRPDHLPETLRHLDPFLLNPHGEVDEMTLTDGTEVHLRLTCPMRCARPSIRATRSGCTGCDHVLRT